MDKGELIKEIEKYFTIQEFVGTATYKKYGRTAWKWIDKDLLETMLIIRQTIGRPITINNWHVGGKYSQRGLRTIVQQLVKNYFYKGSLYLSAHLFGKAVDFDVKGMTANEVREWLIDHKEILPHKIRLENKLKGKYISWVHLDVFWEEKNEKVYLFNV